MQRLIIASISALSAYSDEVGRGFRANAAAFTD
jgi:hypothetical protein